MVQIVAALVEEVLNLLINFLCLQNSLDLRKDVSVFARSESVGHRQQHGADRQEEQPWMVPVEEHDLVVLDAAMRVTTGQCEAVKHGSPAERATIRRGTLFGNDGQLTGYSLFGVAMDPMSGYTTYSIMAQTFVAVLLFAAWWRWMNRHRRIANPEPSP